MSSNLYRCFVFFCRLALIFSLAVVANAQGSSDGTAQVSGSTSAPPNAAVTDEGWHFAASPYLWFAGVHGTAGVDGHVASVHASFGDLLSNLNIGLMGQVEARKKRVLLSNDLMWMKLSDDKALPSNDIGVTSIKVKVRQFLLTPKVGYRVVDSEKLKVDAQVGLRYWHMGQTLEFQPQLFGGVSRSQNWADVVAGGRIEIPLSPKAVVTILGDAGGGGADTDYQVAALLGYKIGKKYILQAGWRYLDVNYRGSQTFVYDAATSGALLGLTINFK